MTGSHFNAYIVDAVRTAGGKRGGRLSGWHPADIGGAVCDALLERANVDGACVEDVVWGCVTQSGAQAENVGRNTVLSSKRLPISVPAFTIDRQCGSAQQALHLAAQAVMSGTQDCLIAGGVEMMSVVPMDSNVNSSWEGGPHTGQEIAHAYKEQMISDYSQFEADPVKFDQFVGAELVAKKYQITRQDADEFAMRSHKLAAEASNAGRFSEIVPMPCRSRKGISKAEAPNEMHKVDEGIRPTTSLESLGKLKPILKNGTLTAAAASQICDGAAAILVCNERGLQRLGLQPRARVVALGLSGIDPITMLDGPIPATQQVLAKAGLTMNDIDLVEVNEAFSSVPLAWAKAMTGGDLSKLNVNGGAIARGHPMGATGAMLMSNLLSELERRGGRFGLQTMCESGGTANATIIEVIRQPQGIASPLSSKPVSAFGYDQSGSIPWQNNWLPVDISPNMQKDCCMTIGRALRTVAAWKGMEPAVTLAGRGFQTRRLTFHELERQSNQLARAYAGFDVERNDFCVVSLPTGTEMVVSVFAVWKLGATPVNVNCSLTFHERDPIVRLASPKIIVGVPNRRDPNMRLHDGFRCIPEGFVPDNRLSFDPLPDSFAEEWLVCTSGGSTGRPKLIVLHAPSFVNMKDIGGGRLAMPDGFSMEGGAKMNGTDLIASPLSHNAPFHCAFQGILGGSHQVLMSKFDAEWMLRLIQDYRCNYTYVVPTVMKRIWDLPEHVRLGYDVSSLEAVFHMAAPCPPWLKEAWCKWLGPKAIWELYGASEAQAYTVIRGDDWVRQPKVPGLNLVGRPALGELKIIDPETKEQLPPGTVGQVWMRHEKKRMTYHYIGGKSAPDEDGWETMGDMGMIDKDGYIHLGDRQSDMVLISGVNVYPAEVEAVLEKHPAVKSAVVVGVPDEDSGKVLHAVVQAEIGHVTADQLKHFAREHLSGVKVPKGFTFADHYLRSEDGKVRRSQIAASLTSSKTSGAGLPLNFAGRVAIVTGAGNGLGKEYAMLLGARGAKVVVNDLGSSLSGQGASASLADITVQEIRSAGGEAVANYNSVTEGAKIVQTAIDAYGRVDIIVNNAGILRDRSFRKMTEEDWDKVYQVHLKGACSVTHAAWPHMEKNEYGRIVNITSSSGLYGSFGQANYAAMKSAILGFTFTLALEGKKRNIQANAVAPLAASRMMETVRTQDELKMLPLRPMANLVTYLCHESCQSTGGIFEMGGHWMSQLGWRRTQGARFHTGFTVEDVAAKFDQISDFGEGVEYPTDDTSGEFNSMRPATDLEETLDSGAALVPNMSRL
jgi:acetyl-CoA C-acetyltransferase